jgi:hypothetical protein
MNWSLLLDNVKFYSVRILDLFDIKGGVILGLFSLEILAMIPYYAVNGVPFPATLRDLYLGVVAAFAATNVAKQYTASKTGGSNEPKA